MPKKRMGTVQHLRTAQKARVRSKPRTQGQEFLDLFILEKLRQRYEREKEQADEDLSYIVRDMADIAKDLEEPWAGDKAVIEKLKDRPISEARKGPESPPRKATKRTKAVPVDY